jgi:hypothetical protein
MRLAELVELCERTHRRYHVLGNEAFAVLAALVVEGRLFAARDGELLHLVRTGAFLGTCTRETYLNPGGDGLWPAPEGSRLGYEYATGSWRVPPGLTGARYAVLDATNTSMVIRAEIDLITSEGLGVPTAFERHVRLAGTAMVVTEVIEYLGPRELPADRCRLAPWSLAQFHGGAGCVARFPAVGTDAVRDLYDPSDHLRSRDGDCLQTATDGSARYQIGLSPDIPWVEMRDPNRGLRIRRTAEPLPLGQTHIDIADLPPDQDLTGAPVHLSVYSDTSGFLELEVAGGCPDVLRPGDRLAVTARTEFHRHEGEV